MQGLQGGLQGVQVMTTQQYFSTCWQGSVVWDLFDSIVQAKQDSGTGNNRVPGTHAPHWSATAVEQGMNAGDVVQVMYRMVMACENIRKYIKKQRQCALSG